MLWCQVVQNVGLSNHELKSAPYDHNAPPSQTDGQTDEHHCNKATIRSIAKCPTFLNTGNNTDQVLGWYGTYDRG